MLTAAAQVTADNAPPDFFVIAFTGVVIVVVLVLGVKALGGLIDDLFGSHRE